MAWKDNLRPASFRGVKFFVDTSQHTTGRRVVFHEFPNRDKPYPEDLGKVGGIWKVEGHILGDDYPETKKLLLAAVEKFGGGELVHPYYGSIDVQCGVVSFDESTKEGGYAAVSFQFYAGGDNQQPRAVDEKLVNLDAKKLKAINSSKSAFDKIYSIAKSPAFVVDAARAGVHKVADLYATATKGGVALAEGAAELAYSIRNLKAETNDLLQQPSKLSKRLIDNFALLEAALSLPKGKLQGYGQFFAYGKDEASALGNTINRRRQNDNKDAFDKLNRRVAVASAAAVAPTATFESSEDALKYREELGAAIEDIILNAEDDDVFADFEDLKALTAELLPDQDASLPDLQTYEVEDTMPSLLVVYDLFENLDSEEDMIARNAIQNPAFILGGSVLEVLNVRKSA